MTTPFIQHQAQLQSKISVSERYFEQKSCFSASQRCFSIILARSQCHLYLPLFFWYYYVFKCMRCESKHFTIYIFLGYSKSLIGASRFVKTMKGTDSVELALQDLTSVTGYPRRRGFGILLQISHNSKCLQDEVINWQPWVSQFVDLSLHLRKSCKLNMQISVCISTKTCILHLKLCWEDYFIQSP